MNIKYFDWKRYINESTDLKRNGITTTKKAYNHYIRYGCKEGRVLAIKKPFLKEYLSKEYKIVKLKLIVNNSLHFLIYNKNYEYKGKFYISHIKKFIDNILTKNKVIKKYINNLKIENDLLILIPVWKRQEILKKCMDFLEKENLKSSVIYLVSNDQDLELVKSRGFCFAFSVNKPLGKKFNNLVSLVKRVNCKYFMILGSDDILEDNYIEKSLDLLKKRNYDVVGTDTQIMHYKNYVYKRTYNGHYNKTFGSGRIYTKKMAEKLKYNFFNNNLNSGLDRSITEKMNKNKMKMGIVKSSIKSFYDEKNHVTNIRSMFYKTNKMVKIN